MPEAASPPRDLPPKALPKILCVAGARPNFMKIAPVMDALRRTGALAVGLVHTGQHYDVAMNQRFFEQLGIPLPDVDLEVGSASHAVQTAEIMRRFEPVLDEEDPAAVLVVGDVNSTIACALVAAKKDIPVAHVEAGLRSYDRSMPEEINRVLTDQLATWHFITERGARDNLLREGIDGRGIHFVGNVMIDTLLRHRAQAVPPERTLAGWAAPWRERGYGVVTLHRPANVDDPEVLGGLVEALRRIHARLPLVFPVHPRTRARLEETGLGALLAEAGLLLQEPLGYLEMLGLMDGARLVLTDSGGMQEETTALGVPCLTLREHTERPITVEQGTNTVVGTEPARVVEAAAEALDGGAKAGRIPELWDGRAAERIAAVLAAELAA
ncbi:MAG: UDP-N-acetylglucosamine 2-epimerase (non-hydrolyzing) [Gammaproteobacteria bacterium]|nr:MAG: UDP-N-acetylglucosamine 2-epimerase (non-hydrolyzing) [Gammaproteobacteria bacterium]